MDCIKVNGKWVPRRLPNPVLNADQAKEIYQRVIAQVSDEIWKRSGGRDEWRKKSFIYDDKR
ncbi:MAG TPA: hypothetical protein VFB72_19395 [Verrucomicrobiae bacterium]|nr:hypothetical protein [Verrucomicrobiae bacterium]